MTIYWQKQIINGFRYGELAIFRLPKSNIPSLEHTSIASQEQVLTGTTHKYIPVNALNFRRILIWIFHNFQIEFDS